MRYISALDSPLLHRPCPRTIVILGSTGSIGSSTLAVIQRHPERFRVLALAGARNIHRLAEQAAQFRPPFLGILDHHDAKTLRQLLPPGYMPTIVWGTSGYEELASLPEASHVVAAQVGAAGLLPALAAARSGKVLALATKEALVLAGHLFRAACAASGAVIVPVDSEHNALFQALLGHNSDAVRRLILTASGGPFRSASLEEMARATPASALQHPTWSMGAKISIDSATLMNKGLELLEAAELFGVAPHELDVVIHPQSLIHGMVALADGSILAQMGPATMEVPLAMCLGYPDRLHQPHDLDLARLGQLTFEAPDTERFPCLALAWQALGGSRTHRIALNAANEIAVEAFLAGRIPFLHIPRIVAATLEATADADAPDIQAVLQADHRARQTATHILETLA